MSKHVGRKQRWSRVSPGEYVSEEGRAVRRRDGWYAVFDYRLPAPAEDPQAPPAWETHRRQFGPFKRPRNAMVALEREVTFLRNRHGKDLLLGGRLWAESSQESSRSRNASTSRQTTA